MIFFNTIRRLTKHIQKPLQFFLTFAIILPTVGYKNFEELEGQCYDKMPEETKPDYINELYNEIEAEVDNNNSQDSEDKEADNISETPNYADTDNSSMITESEYYDSLHELICKYNLDKTYLGWDAIADAEYYPEFEIPAELKYYISLENYCYAYKLFSEICLRTEINPDGINSADTITPSLLMSILLEEGAAELKGDEISGSNTLNPTKQRFVSNDTPWGGYNCNGYFGLCDGREENLTGYSPVCLYISKDQVPYLADEQRAVFGLRSDFSSVNLESLYFINSEFVDRIPENQTDFYLNSCTLSDLRLSEDSKMSNEEWHSLFVSLEITCPALHARPSTLTLADAAYTYAFYLRMNYRGICIQVSDSIREYSRTVLFTDAASKCDLTNHAGYDTRYLEYNQEITQTFSSDTIKKIRLILSLSPMSGQDSIFSCHNDYYGNVPDFNDLSLIPRLLFDMAYNNIPFHALTNSSGIDFSFNSDIKNSMLYAWTSVDGYLVYGIDHISKSSVLYYANMNTITDDYYNDEYLNCVLSRLESSTWQYALKNTYGSARALFTYTISDLDPAWRVSATWCLRITSLEHMLEEYNLKWCDALSAYLTKGRSQNLDT